MVLCICKDVVIYNNLLKCYFFLKLDRVGDFEILIKK